MSHSSTREAACAGFSVLAYDDLLRPGRLIALYEHKVAVQGLRVGDRQLRPVGVELGKELAGGIIPELEPGVVPGAHDSSTTGADCAVSGGARRNVRLPGLDGRRFDTEFHGVAHGVPRRRNSCASREAPFILPPCNSVQSSVKLRVGKKLQPHRPHVLKVPISFQRCYPTVDIAQA
jgi:hypothetical protein